MTAETLPSGNVLTYTYTYTYNSNHQVTSVKVGSTTILNTITYAPLGPVTGWTWGNSTTTTRVFDQDYKMSQFTSAGNKVYTYDDASRITGTTDTGTGAAAWTYGYDLLDRVTSASKTGTAYGWTYDANGNRLTQTSTAATTFNISATSNRITTTTGSLARTYSYDAAGDVTGYTAATAAYNNRGRMKTLTKSSVTATYVYNALGQLAKQSGGTPGTAHYMYDEAGHLIGEYDGSGALVQETVWLGDVPLATLRPHTGGGIDIYYVHSDNLNTPVRVTRPSDNKLMWTWYSSPFGTELPNENPASGGTFKYNLRFPGQRYDSHAGLNQNYFRDYDPAVARYTKSDPNGFSGGLNTYTYALGNSISNADPLGLWTANVGLTISGQFAFVNISYSIGVVIDGTGKIGTYANPFAGPGLGGGGSIGLSFGGSSARTIESLNGLFSQVSGAVGLGANVGGTAYGGNDERGAPVVGGEVTVGLGFGAGASAGTSNTIVAPAGQVPSIPGASAATCQ